MFKDRAWLKFLDASSGVPIKLDVRVFNDFKDFFDSEVGHSYSYFVQYPTGKAQNDAILKHVVTNNWDNAGYRLLYKNCSNLVIDALIEAGAFPHFKGFAGPNERAFMLQQDMTGKRFTHYWRNAQDMIELVQPRTQRFTLFKSQLYDMGDGVRSGIIATTRAVKDAGDRVNEQIRRIFFAFNPFSD